MNIALEGIIEEVKSVLSQLSGEGGLDTSVDLFDQGVNSLQLTLLIAHLNSSYKLELGMDILSGGATVDAVASAVRENLLNAQDKEIA
ncbi:acyl carrier protein [Pseudomonas graminis]|uniref:acyl carrier protein n=1 Tax=Pseudomonas graminis TaxID=158627 RepID=UPI00234BD7D7|nr:acyl carrier protein [Pseudomonas graminis]MDC6382019.1 acyl carrier protein [Pseudomonas graminis]